MLAYCVHYTKSREDAEEIVQDVFVALWNSRETIRQEETLHSLLFTISKHRVINAYRSTLNSLILLFTKIMWITRMSCLQARIVIG